MQFIKHIIPQKFHSDRKGFQQIYTIVVVDIIIILTSLCYIPLYYLAGFEVGAYIMIYSILAAIFYLFLLKYGQNLDWCGNYFTFQCLSVCLVLMIFTGGVSSPYSFWLFCICPITFLFFKKKIASFWTIITVFCFLVLSAFQLSGYPFESQLSSTVLNMLWTFNFCFGIFIVVSTIRNFQTGIKKVNSKLKGTNTKLKNTNEELERFAYIASHDLKSPLRSIISFITLFNKRYKGQIDENGQEFLEIIATNADQMQHLIEDILEYSKSKTRIVKKEKVDLNKVLTQIVNHIDSKDFYLDGKIHFGHLPEIESDFTMIKQLFQNLIENGLKYNHGPHKLVSVQYLEKETELYFMIKDNGIGMEKAYFEKIFEMFQRLHTKNEYQGTGIGLAICKKIVQQLNGNIWVTSKLNEGSIFHLTFPKSTLWSKENQEKSENLLELNV